MFDITSLLSLNIIIFAPAVAALIVASPLFGTNQIYIRRFTKTFATIHLLYSLFFVAYYLYGSDNFYQEITILGNSWLSKLGINAAFGADGFTILLCAFTSLIFLFVFIISKTMIRTKHKMYYALMLVLFSSTLGIFCAKDMFVFLLFWQTELIPIFLLISQWGGVKAPKAAQKYILYNFSGSLLLMVAMISLYYYGYHANGTLSSSIDFLRIYQADNIFPELLQDIIFWCLFIGFAVKLPIIPFHTCYTSCLTEAPAPVRALISSVLINTAAYGLIRFNLDLFPELFTKFAPIIMLIAVTGILWASFGAFKQKEIVKTTAYINIVYMGFFLLGLSAANKTGFDGAFFIMFANIFVAAALSIMTGYIEQTFKTKSFQEIAGLGKFAPRLMSLSYIIIFAVIGVPLTISFSGFFLVFSGAFSADFADALMPKICTAVSFVSFILLAASGLRLLDGCFGGISQTEKKYNDITGHRLMVLLILCLFIIFFGCFPDSLMSFYSDVTDMLAEVLRV
ncbi:MAG: NADH-quinone oxidoreductase subunit M [Candidatus Gastranaerophilales bacterium]|nr:NADH-quinone oxidoreductase subunit M [Candidatus Gastranaerophilales bacterium]